MKRLMMLIPFLVIRIFAFGASDETYVTLNDNGLKTVEASKDAASIISTDLVADRLLCKNVYIGMKFSKVILTNGGKVKLHTSDITSYRLNNKFYCQLPLFENGKNSNQMVFMRLIGQKHDLNLFMYEEVDNNKVAEEGTDPVNYYFVFQGNQYEYEVGEDNYKEVFKKFGITVYSMDELNGKVLSFMGYKK